MRRLLLVMSAVALALLPACGEEGGDPLGIVQTAGAATRSAGTVKVEMSMQGPMTAGPELTTIKAAGVFDFEPVRGSLTMSFPEELVGSGGPAEMDMAFEGTTMFMRLPDGERPPDVDTEWVSFDFAELGEQITGTDLNQLMNSGSDPTQALAMLEGVSDDVEEVGTEDVRGEPTTRYRATVDLRRASEEAGAVTDPAQFERFIEMLGADRMEMEIWIDGEGRVRRQTYEQPIPNQDRALSVTVEMFDFGTDEEPEIPAPEDVTDITDQIAEEIERNEGSGEAALA